MMVVITMVSASAVFAEAVLLHIKGLIGVSVIN